MLLACCGAVFFCAFFQVGFHPQSLNFKLATRRDRWAVYLEKVETSRVFIRDSTIVTPFALLLFGGTPVVNHDKGTITVDGWIEFLSSPAIGVLFRLIREELDAILLDRIGDTDGSGEPGQESTTDQMIAGLVALLEKTGRRD